MEPPLRPESSAQPNEQALRACANLFLKYSPEEYERCPRPVLDFGLATLFECGRLDDLIGRLMCSEHIDGLVRVVGLVPALRAHAQSVNALIKVGEIDDDPELRMKFARKFLLQVGAAYERNYGRIGNLWEIGEALWSIHGTLTAAGHLRLWTEPPPPLGASGALPEGPELRAMLLALQHAGEVGRELLALEIHALADQQFPGSPKLLHFAAGSALRHSYTVAPFPGGTEQYARKAIAMERRARRSGRRDSFRSVMISTEGHGHVWLGKSLKAQGHLAEGEREVRLGLDLIEERLECYRSATAVDMASEAHAELGDHAQALALAREATSKEAVLPQSQLTILEHCQSSDPTQPDYMGAINRSIRCWIIIMDSGPKLRRND
jgi:hypothetical protein